MDPRTHTQRFTVAEEETGERLDRFLARRLDGASRRDCQTLLAEGQVRVDGRQGRKGDTLRAGQLVEAGGFVPREDWRVHPEPELPLEVVHEDPWLVAVSKVSGQHCLPRTPEDHGTLAGALIARYPELAGVGGGLETGLVHRLDVGTSGLVLVARSPESWETLRGEWGSATVEKRYLAWVEGLLEEPLFIDAPLTQHGPRAHVSRKGRAARTFAEPLAERDGRTLLRLELMGGARHQLRVHLAHAGYPIIGDVHYGGPEAERIQLHALALTFPHPANGRPCTLAADAPSGFRP